jgi:hypothetical protein
MRQQTVMEQKTTKGLQHFYNLNGGLSSGPAQPQSK